MPNRKAIITGASQGIGAAIALKLAQEGYHTLLIARNEEKLKAVKGEILVQGGSANYYLCDVSNANAVAQTLQKIKEDEGELPLTLVNNAGWGGPFHKANEVSEAEWDAVFNTNVKSAFLFCRSLLPEMQAQGFGRIINISSIFGKLGGLGSSTYSASKHALIGYTKSLAVEWGGFGITVNSISPGYIATSMTEINPYNKAYFEAVFKQIPSGKMGKPEDIAGLVAFLANPSTTYMNGENVVIDGGLTAGFDFR
ncbi:MAG: SDR family NAD(P)-dependent oxidoreductase [Bacteroidia bacterium]